MCFELLSSEEIFSLMIFENQSLLSAVLLNKAETVLRLLYSEKLGTSVSIVSHYEC